MTKRILTPRNGARVPVGDGTYLTRGSYVDEDHPLVAANRGLFMQAPPGAKSNDRTTLDDPKDRSDVIAAASLDEPE